MLNMKKKVERNFIYRAWRYFRDGYAMYVHYPLGVFSFLTVTYSLFIERVPVLKFIFSNFTFYSIVACVVFVPLSVFFGWWHMRRSNVYGIESILAAESNPLTARSNRVLMETTMTMCKALKVDMTPEYMALYHYWKKHDEKMNWRPS